jgi:hypothetical protein
MSIDPAMAAAVTAVRTLFIADFLLVFVARALPSRLAVVAQRAL